MSDETGRNTNVTHFVKSAERVWQNTTELLTALPLPRRCPVCGGIRQGPTAATCPACLDNLPLVGKAVCSQCRQYREFNTAPCDGCQNEVPPIAVMVVSILDVAWRDVVHALKYRSDRSLAAPLGHLMAAALPDSLLVDSVVPIPTDRSKRGERGYGHAELLAQAIAQAHGVSFWPDYLKRVRRTKDQTRLSGVQRFTNLDGAFRVRDRYDSTGASILIVDDVMTTGATVGEAARALTEAGANEVLAIVLCLNLGIVSDRRY